MLRSYNAQDVGVVEVETEDVEEVEEAVREEEEVQTALQLRSMRTSVAETQSLAPTVHESPIATIAAPRMDIGHMNEHNWMHNNKRSFR